MRRLMKKRNLANSRVKASVDFPPKEPMLLLGKTHSIQRKGINIKKITTYKKGRKCKHPRCKHILSIYNTEIYCHVHSPMDHEPVSAARF